MTVNIHLCLTALQQQRSSGLKKKKHDKVDERSARAYNLQMLAKNHMYRYYGMIPKSIQQHNCVCIVFHHAVVYGTMCIQAQGSNLKALFMSDSLYRCGDEGSLSPRSLVTRGLLNPNCAETPGS